MILVFDSHQKRCLVSWLLYREIELKQFVIKKFFESSVEARSGGYFLSFDCLILFD